MRNAVLILMLSTSPGVGLTAGPAHADPPTLSVQLNGAEDRDGTCRLTFVAENRLGADLSALVLEAVVFTPAGHVDRLALLDFQTLPQARPRVRQFDLPGLSCDGVGQVLINAATPCTGEGLDPSVCIGGLRLSSRVDGMEISG